VLVNRLKRLKAEAGFTTVTLMGVLMVGGLLVMAAFTAVDPDIRQSRDDVDSKQAYAAAESGLQWYMNALGRDNTYYLKCDNPPAPNATEVAPVNQQWTTGAFKWRNVTGEQSKYGIELIPATGYSSCLTTDQYSMINPEGNLQLRITGRSRDETRTILATLRRQNFLDFIYFTHFETLDPAAYSDPDWATTNCAKYRAQRDGSCTEIQFANNDKVLGPFHTNDNAMICGNTQFGEKASDRVEFNGPTPYVDAGGCNADPNIVGTQVFPAGELAMPPSNQELKNIALPAYRYTGKTKITLNGTSMTVTNANLSGGVQTVALPSNGVIYVDNASCTAGYDRTPDYTEPSGCGNVYVHGSYGANLTIGAANDVIVDGNLTRGSEDLLLGLIANNFVRVYHPCSSGTNGTGSVSNIDIDAAILALNHSFIVDNWACGNSLGNLNVDGAIAQYFRGPVGTSGGTGYIKNYTYNRLLKYREPPYFLDPQLASWRVSRQTEQVPPRSVLP
jgi:hypothetical protein